jgi:hypothetical protein
MKCIYEASSGLEAHMILNLLQQEALNCRVDGEYLQGGAGELQAMNMVRVLVDESDYTKAQEIINNWEATQVQKEDASIPKNKSSRLGLGLITGFLVGAGATFIAYNSPVYIDGVDYNDDGELDEKWIYRDNRISRAEVDRNLDGNMDAIHSYNRKGRIYKTEQDDNFDGVYESIVTYKRGNPVMQESDLNNDGITDYRIHFSHGVLHQVEIVGPAPNSPRKLQTYEMNKLISSRYDSDGDGVYDRIYEYDFYEEIKE